MSLLESFTASPGVRRAVEVAAASRRPPRISGAQGVALPLFCMELARDSGDPLITILPDDDSLRLFERELAWMLENEGLADRWQVLRFPDYDIPELESQGAAVETRKNRLKALDAIYSGDGPTPWVLATQRGAARKTMPANIFRDLSVNLSEGSEYPMGSMLDLLVNIGYQKRKTVKEAGHFCVRGGMIDVFPAQLDEPVRIETAGDTIEEIRPFDTETQRSSGRIPGVRVCPCSEAAINLAAGGMENLRGDHRSLVERGVYFDGAILYPDTFAAGANPVLDGRFTDVLIIDERRCADEAERQKEEALKWLEWNEFDDPEELYEAIYASIDGELPGSRVLHLAPHFEEGEEEVIQLPVSLMPPLPMKLTSIAEKLRSESSRGEVAVVSKYRRRLSRFLEDEGIEGIETYEGDLRGGVCVTDLPFSIFTDSDMFHRPPDARRRTPGRKKHSQPIRAPEDIEPGDYVVHVDHGVGVYQGTELQSSGDGYRREFFKIRYGKGDVLFVPVDQVVQPVHGAGKRHRPFVHRRQHIHPGARRLFPIRRNGRPGAGHQRGAPGHGAPRADGQAGIRRRGLREDGSRRARGVQGGAGQEADGPAGPDDNPRAPAREDLLRAHGQVPRYGGSALPVQVPEGTERGP